MRYEYIGWCKEGAHDKVWGIICLTEDDNYVLGKYVSFWGRRGAKLQTKTFEATDYDVYRMYQKKEDKGYKKIEEHELDNVYPEFQSDLEKTAVFSILRLK